MKIPTEEIWFSFSRSGGPGGQNVNKVSSKVTLHWAFQVSNFLSENQRFLLLSNPKIRSFLDADGIINLTCQISRSQANNRKLALEKLQELVNLALLPKIKRKKTKPSKGQKEKRLQYKKTRSQRLKGRQIKFED